ncbi:MAG: hypothetical protein JW954_05105 [Dehalococcoidaceae bacterium]|nr:hypothetical protein [Dehalococcoidaceae bacterium]
MKRVLALISIIAIVATVGLPVMVFGAEGETCASNVYDFYQGTQKGGGTIGANRSDPSNALGSIDNSFFSLGFIDQTSGGWIILEFEDYVGTYLNVVEQSPGTGANYPLEQADVYVSSDSENPTNWTMIGTANNQIAGGSATGQSHINTFDLEECIKFVKIVDTTDPSLHTNTGDAFDLDAVCAGPCQQMDVYVDIKPQSCPNPLNLGSKGVVSVAILGTESFDVTNVDPATVMLAGVLPLRWSLEDVATPYTGELVDCNSGTTDGPDGYMDLVFKFDKEELIVAIGEVEEGCLLLELNGALLDTTEFVGYDFVKIIDNENNGAGPMAVEQNSRKDNAPGLNKLPGEPAVGKGKK